MYKKYISILSLAIGWLMVIVFLFLSISETKTYKIKLYKNVENNMAFSDEDGIRALEYSLELRSVENKKSVTGKRNLVANIKIKDGVEVFSTEVKKGRSYSFRNGDIFFDEIPTAGDTECVFKIVYNPYKLCVFAGILLIIVGSLRSVYEAVLEQRKLRFVGSGWILSIVMLLLPIVLLLLYLLFPAIRGAENGASRLLLYDLHRFMLYVSIGYSATICAFGAIASFIEKRDADLMCRIPAKINLGVMMMSAALFMLWSQLTSGVFIRMNFATIGMAIAMIALAIFLYGKNMNNTVKLLCLFLNLLIISGLFV